MNTSPKAVNSAQTEREALLKAASALEDEYMAVAQGAKKPSRIALEPMVKAVQELRKAAEARAASPAPASPSGEDAAEQADEADFKNFHRLLCERFGYVHDEAYWKRDQLSLIERIADKQTNDAGRYRRFRRWHPRLQTSYWTGQWWEPIYGEKMDACIDGLDEVPQPTPHADQSAARAKDSK